MNRFSAAGSTRLAALLALFLLVVGFIVGYGYGYGVYQKAPAVPTPTPAPWTPVTEGLRVALDDRLLAFTGIYDQSQHASRFLLDLKTGGFSAVESPTGWQDYITQWSADGRTILFEREKIPRPVETATAGLYQEKAHPIDAGPGNAGEPVRQEPTLLTADKIGVDGETATSGFWTPDGKLVVKTRREPKALFVLRDGHPQLLDRATLTYYQNRAVVENGQNAYYVVRDMPGQAQSVALYRAQNGHAQQLSPALTNVTWAYVAENARWMIVCQQAANGTDWLWSLYQVSPQTAHLVKQNTVPSDIVTVYWSPDFKRVLGASGDALWIVDIPSLQAHQVGTRKDWKADNAVWLNHENAVIVATEGKLWKVLIPSGTSQQLWKFPQRYWQ